MNHSQAQALAGLTPDPARELIRLRERQEEFRVSILALNSEAISLRERTRTLEHHSNQLRCEINEMGMLCHYLLETLKTRIQTRFPETDMQGLSSNEVETIVRELLL